MRPINEIIVHCTATRPEWMAGRPLAEKVAEIRRWHVSDRGWKDIGYHYLIDRDGKVAEGRPLAQIGAHVAGRNTGTIGIALFGGHGSAETDAFAANFTPAQDQALRGLIAKLMKAHPTIVRVSGHNLYARKACPGFNVPSWYAAARASAPVTPAPQPDALKPATGLWGALVALLRRIFGGLQ